MEDGKPAVMARTVAVLLTALVVAVAAPAAGAAVFTNGAPITTPPGGQATPYPSPIAVSGLSGAVTDVKVTLRSITHEWAADLDVLLVGPFGQSVVLMADAGDGHPISDITLTFDQAAAGTVPTPMVSGTYRPTIVFGAFNGTPPAPPGPYGTSLALFNGTVPNGTWNLYVFDDAFAGVGTIQGWSLDITTNGPTISSFTPTGGAAGTAVAITGENFTGATSVTFGGFAASSFTVNSATSITATVPPGAVSGPISVTTPAGTTSSAVNYEISAPPAIASFTPTRGKVGTQVTITGTNLTGATAVAFGGTPATAIAAGSDTQLTATVPAGAGAGPIVVTTPGGQATSPVAFNVVHSRRISLQLTRRRARGRLVAVDGFGRCAETVPVVLRRRSQGVWRDVASRLTTSTGRFSFRSRARGRYRAVARHLDQAGGDICNRARSAVSRRSQRR